VIELFSELADAAFNLTEIADPILTFLRFAPEKDLNECPCSLA